MYRKQVTFTKTNQYGCGPDDEDDVYTVAEFLQHVADHSFIDYDGFGYPVKNGKYDPDIVISPSKIDQIPSDATHIVWYNR
jgi:hypothetical protein